MERESHRSKVETSRLHERYVQRSKRDPGRVLVYGREFLDAFEAQLKDRVDRVQELTLREDWVNLMLPRGINPPSPPKADYWNTRMWGYTPNERLHRARRRALKRMLSQAHMKEAVMGYVPPPVLQIIMDVAGNEPWLSGVVQEVFQALESSKNSPLDVDVIDHFEHLATLDDTTCDECAALDGTEVPVGDLGSMFGSEETAEAEAVMLVDIHPNCRCVPVPVTKSWEELGFSPEQEPEGTRIARMGPQDEAYTPRASPVAYRDPQGGIHDEWQPGYTPVGGNQYYVPADIRYDEWSTTRTGAAL